MSSSRLLSIATATAMVLLSACAHLEEIRSDGFGSTSGAEHCRACSDLGQAWALFRMGELEQAETYGMLVLEGERGAEGGHARRARDLVHLARGCAALESGDHPAMQASFREIRDPELLALGRPYVDPAGIARSGAGRREKAEGPLIGLAAADSRARSSGR